MRIGAIADDLTGATDLGLMFARAGLKVMQCVGVPFATSGLEDAQAIIVSLKTRTVSAAEAVAQSLEALAFLQAAGADRFLFKYCSTFDSTDEGNIGPVIDALMERLGETRTIACPAMPANGRTVYQGHLFVGTQLLSESPMKDHPLTPMRDANLVRVLQRQTARPVSLVSHALVAEGGSALEFALDGISGMAVVDAIDEVDLVRIGKAARDLRLLTGGSGIGLGMAANFPAAELAGEPVVMAPAPGKGVILAGSCSAATRRQIAAAVAAGVPAMRVMPQALAGRTLTVEHALAFVAVNAGGLPPILYSSAEPDEIAAVQAVMGREEAGALVENFLGDVARALLERGTTRFVVAGGETSGAVTHALGARTLVIGPEIDPGVPWTTFVHEGRIIALALKSGNFGADDFFLKAWELLA
ncbi:3-oxo-tetronate kinase [Flavisphingomonas formosensis]|uniref:3-oxo-tetronate kinase n=1 Tax=Flavisphingomonas formosensis TaxID=861534 RepID=UPI0012F9E7C4|nr:3-oxo-tetronate kinase [Sphingomonas formosensis]